MCSILQSGGELEGARLSGVVPDFYETDGLERGDVVADAAGAHCKIGRKAIVSSRLVRRGVS